MILTKFYVIFIAQCIPVEIMQNNTENMTPESLASFVTDNDFNKKIADKIMADELTALSS